MFGDLMGNLEQQQAEIQKKLKNIIINETKDGITISGDATKTVTNLSIDSNLLDPQNKEMLEDVLISCINNFVAKASKTEAEETQKIMSEMLPPGFGDLFK
jgi:nucleoid-associated protein EbfC